MFSLKLFVITSAAIAGVLSTPTNATVYNCTLGGLSLPGSTTTCGYGNGYFYYCWIDGEDKTPTGYPYYNNGGGGMYSVTWSDNSSLTCGKGWNPGTSSR
ncbi:hypothetical protein CVT24_002965 [Panaeolus cyanescens]|uniref:GH11 domain-containing protein n=1 Tax=Panaeolus cyanescens TaxID=181874 RepID=A0A409X3V7_9AGAR|nr:hypothetical protein CVT24_002965 [Panaeolus cyanescens]